MHSEEDGIITIAWVATTAIDFSANDLFDINFQFNSGFSEIEILTCKMKNALGQTYNLTYSQGSIAANNLPQIKLLSPNGGEYFEVTGPQQLITWTSVYIGLIDISYTTDNGTNWNAIDDNIDALEGKYLWTIPTISSTTVKVKVTEFPDSTVFDESDNNFRIDSDQSIDLASPNGGEVLKIGGAKVINWTSKNVDNVLIEYSSNSGGTWNTIIASTLASVEFYIWDIPNDASVNCLVKVSNADNPAISDVSVGVFEITASPVSITISHEVNSFPLPLPIPYNPTLADILTEVPLNSGWLTAVTSLQIKISYDKEAIDLYVGDNYIDNTSILYQVGNFIPSYDDTSLTLFWSSNLPFDLQGQLFLIRAVYSDGTDIIVDPNSIFSELKFISAVVKDVRGNTIDLDLTNGSISKTPLPAVKLLQPLGGEVLSINTAPYLIKFSSVNTANVGIDFTADGGTSWSQISAGVSASSGEYSWDYSAYSNSNNCAIFVGSGAAPSMTTTLSGDVSGIFEISNTKVLDLLSPDGGEVLQFGKIKNISWYSQNIDNISIDFSSDNGVTWENIIPDAPAVGGIYAWRVPDSISTECLIEISDGAVSDISQAVFTIGNNIAVVRLSRIGDLVYVPPIGGILQNPLSIYVDFENLNSITYMALQFSFDKNVYLPNLTNANTLKAIPLSTLAQNGDFIASVNDTTISIMWTSQTPVDLHGTLIRVDGEYYGGSTDLRLLTAQFFDLSGLSMNINLMDGRLSDATVGVDGNEEITPEKYFISQNYPNPFNPSTVIKYGIPEGSKVSLMVYNTIGQRVATLVDEFKSAGVHNVTWNAGNLANGVYFYRIVIDGSEQGFVETKKLLLLK